MTSYEERVHLSPWEECIGPCHKIEPENGCIIAYIGKISIILPPDMVSKFEGLEGRRIGVLRTDKDYRIRDFNDQG
jgi:hypothetical protein